MRFIYIFLFSVLSFGIVAETSEQYTYRAEFFFGDIEEGKSYEDVKAQNMEYKKFLEEKGLQYGRSLFVPIWSGERKYDIIEYGYWPSGEEQYREWGAYMNKYPAWAEENSQYEGADPVYAGSATTVKRAISMRGVRARGIRIPQEERDRFNFVDFRRCELKNQGSIEKLLDLNARVEAAEIEMGNRAGYGIHYLEPYRGIDENVDYDFVIMRHYYSAEMRSSIVTSSPSFREMMNKNGFYKEFRRYAKCGPESTFRVEWLYNSYQD
jgi:hypothetical protein